MLINWVKNFNNRKFVSQPDKTWRKANDLSHKLAHFNEPASQRSLDFEYSARIFYSCFQISDRSVNSSSVIKIIKIIIRPSGQNDGRYFMVLNYKFLLL